MSASPTATALLEIMIQRFDEVHDRHDLEAVDQFVRKVHAVFGCEMALQLLDMLQRRESTKRQEGDP